MRKIPLGWLFVELSSMRRLNTEILKILVRLIIRALMKKQSRIEKYIYLYLEMTSVKR